MAKNQRNVGRMGPLSVGNVVTGGIRLYRDHFQEYYRLALIGSLWGIIPIYGWAKYSEMHGLIARLAFQEAIERPETVQQARQRVQPRMWSFLGAGFLIFLIFMGAMFGGGIAVGIIAGIIGGILGQNNGVIILVSILGGLALIVLYIWLYTKLSIVELPIAMENIGATDSISRSWNLTKGLTRRLIGVYLLALVISLPIALILQVVIGILQMTLVTIFPNNIPLSVSLYLVGSLVVSLLGSALLIPFWQAIKGIIYYDLRSRQEGMGLNLGRRGKK
ncbi:DUF975 domain-containing protein [Laspinema sp. A4]|uniref:DUF975 domain-containing protein n=1 Tax=Laspinema sp. D2d TaxID=2953686 RepID=UPI0021BA4106|nr:DUF975 domain-containing protein [Laspinema sp. D2d]MCT7983362.1 DUF975 domain-containing protein [Laspinema sp. D2d]